jgi:glycerol-3-phosphate acyltransferase PlsX
LNTDCHLAVDVMSGDFGPRFAVPAAVEFVRQHPDTTLTLVGDPSLIQPLLPAQPHSRLRVEAAASVVAMDEKPSFALRKRQDSSMYRAIQLVADGRAGACVSAGNTGALMAMSYYQLHMHPGIERPAIATTIPTRNGHCYMLDLGANVDCRAEHLFQCALMGSALVEAVEANARPRVALLNVGTEANKGNEQVKLADRLLREHSLLNYIGYIEGDGIYNGDAEVVVCDGFVGNVALKTSEGLARMVSAQLKTAFNQSWYRRLLAGLVKPVLTQLQQELDPSRRNGASLLGLQGIVVKSHGGAEQLCFGHAIAQARAEVLQDVSGLINAKLGQLL